MPSFSSKQAQAAHIYKDATGSGARSTQQTNKKPTTDAKKKLDETATEDGGTAAKTNSGGGGGNMSNVSGSSGSGPSTSSTASTTNTVSASNAKDEDDIYEFKSTPKDSSSSSGDDKSDGEKVSDKSSDEKSDNQGVNSTTAQSKRSYSDVENADESANNPDDEIKRKKRKDSEQAKEVTSKTSACGKTAAQRSDKNSKASGSSSKNVCPTNKTAAMLDGKSPCPSPKQPNKTTDSDAEADDCRSGESFVGGGLKVPPLKIVIPQQSTCGDQETGTRNGKNTSARSHAALPYVVATSSNSNDSIDKESESSRCASPIDLCKLVDDKKPMSNEEQRQQRVLRSSHRGGQSVDRGSNNSSPQLQSSLSPAPANVVEPSDQTSSTKTFTTSSVSSSTTNTNSNTTASNTVNSPNTNLTTDTYCSGNVPSPSASSSSSAKELAQSTVDLHPRKRKIRASKDDNKQATNVVQSNDNNDNFQSNEIHPHDQPMTNCYQHYLNIRKQIERRQRLLLPVQPKPPQGFNDYLLNRCTYVLASKTPMEPVLNFPANIATQMRELFTPQEKERHKLKMQHIVEKEKLVLAVEQEILRVHGRAARALANQSLPFSACTILKDEEVYNMITPEQEEKDRNARSRYNGRLFISWLQDVDDKWEKIKEAMVLRHHNEAESLHAVQKMDWEWKMKELSLCEYKAQPVIEDIFVPMVHVSDAFDLLPA